MEKACSDSKGPRVAWDKDSGQHNTVEIKKEFTEEREETDGRGLAISSSVLPDCFDHISFLRIIPLY